MSEGMLPNRFPDRGDAPEYNSVDASLWYVVAVHELPRRAAATLARRVAERRATALHRAVDAILERLRRGTRYGIRADADGLLASGEPGVQLTWMDAKVGDWVVTPRIGKPVEIQALWLNALRDRAAHSAARWRRARSDAPARRSRALLERGSAAACTTSSTSTTSPDGADDSFRPNQILAVGGLPLSLLDDAGARRVVDAVESRLLTPIGLRSLAPDAPGYAARYEGSGAERDGRYHQGTVWPWLIGPFVEAWLRVHGSTADTRREARATFLEPLLQLAAVSGGQLPRSPTPSRRTRREDARPRRGRSRKCCASSVSLATEPAT